ncbi:MAG: hypothetical protein K0R38_773 [Polyangiaceae bacterium]|jgi:hypothetical protein|nr:hypothetical protein [Polyangiaceae bacterium]
MKARALAVGVALGFAACGGNPFGTSDDDTPNGMGGSANEAGTSGSAEAGEGTGAVTTGGSANNAGEANGGATPPSGDGGMPPSVGGSSSNTGGDAGAGGEPPVVMEPVFTMSKLIDDMEDGNKTLLETNGDWFVIKDETAAGVITPPKEKPFTMTTLTPARGASTKAAVVTVSGFLGWGAALGFDFLYANGVRQPADLGPALAVRFWAKASQATTVRFQLPNADTDELGGKCTTAEKACNAHWTKAFNVGTQWQQTTIQLSELKQDLPGRHVPTFDKQHVYGAFFVIGPNQSVTVSIDDVALVH